MNDLPKSPPADALSAGTEPCAADGPPTLAIVVKGYPRLSETFIAQEIEGLEQRGLRAVLISLRHPTETTHHPVHERIQAAVSYLPEYLYQEPLRVLRGWWAARRLPGYRAARAQWLRDWRRDRTANRGRRWGQALVLAHELPASVRWLHVHFLHTPASVTRYAAMMRGLPWSGSAHAKDIWTTPDWEITEKLADCRWLVTCTAAGRDRLAALAPSPETVSLVYHGLDLAHLPAPPASPRLRDGRDATDPVVILSVGRRVEKKGLDDVLEALALLPRDLHWRFEHIGGGPLGAKLKARASQLGLAARCTWHGPRERSFVFDAYARADVFVLASKIAGDGDRDGLPNVLMEAQSQGVACVATRVSAIPELIDDGDSGLLVPPGDPAALAAALESAIRDPSRRARMAAKGAAIVRSRFSFDSGVDRIAGRLKSGIALARRAAPA
ncbi:MAG TPA: glycosyltransferase [Vineibacter terrae]|nr:glycosyltransferase [Vineibacter terrae]HEX2891009.1 glycosyltransferase [Vineibacter terrae]